MLEDPISTNSTIPTAERYSLRILGMSWGIKTTCFEVWGVSLGGSGVSKGGVKSVRAVSKMAASLTFHLPTSDSCHSHSQSSLGSQDGDPAAVNIWVPYMIPVRGSLPPPPPHMVWSQNLRFAAFRMKTYLQCFLHGGCWRGPQTCKFVGFLQPTFRKRVICNVLASTSWSSAAAPSSISMSNCHIILNLLLRVYSLGTRLISVYILCLSNFPLECLVFRNWSNLKFS